MLFHLILKKIILFSGDIVLFFISLIIALLLRYGNNNNNFSWDFLKDHLVSFSLAAPLWFLAMIALGQYDLENFNKKEELLLKTIFFWIFLIISSIIVFYLFPHKNIAPKKNLLSFSLIFCLLIFLWRSLIKIIFLSYFTHGIIILDQNQETKELTEKILKNPHLGYRFYGFFNYNKILTGNFDKKNVYTVILPSRPAITIIDLQRIYQSMPEKTNVVSVVNAYEKILKKIPTEYIDQEWLINNLEKTKKINYEKIKRLLDFLLSFLIIIVSFPILLFISAMIIIFNGPPVVYKQKRVGLNNKEFVLYKFRTMIKNAEKNGARWASENDKRITFLGKILRKTHLDEIPQMFNVLKGDLSLIGPRPERPEFVNILSQKIPCYRLRHIIKPGFTGWAQIKFRYGRSIKDSREKFQYDFYYIKNRSLFLDLQILLKTVYIFFKKN